MPADFDPFAGRIDPSAGRRPVETARVPLWVHDTGGRAGEPVLLLGGFTAGHFAFDFVRPLLRTPRRLHHWEPRGLGRSPAPTPRPSLLGRDLGRGRRRACSTRSSCSGCRSGRSGLAATSPIASPPPTRTGSAPLVTYSGRLGPRPGQGLPADMGGLWRRSSATSGLPTLGRGCSPMSSTFQTALVRRMGGANIEAVPAPRDGCGDGRLLPARGRRA